ncbi:hypothetical protein, conserved [Leishmania tarentolae]|uniref:Uncharacterized protein n=1 Tax=Leishmania tarentolae TaxID=5689 RepID=A0A640K893_LEITA|nr:hypothetical protein, conserved [Leishmania tarentolae]
MTTGPHVCGCVWHVLCLVAVSSLMMPIHSLLALSPRLSPPLSSPALIFSLLQLPLVSWRACTWTTRMLRHSSRLLVRLPKSRRPRERPWEIFNVRDFGYHEGSQNYMMWFCAAAVFTSMLAFEVYQQMQRIFQRGDTCSACEAARAHYRKRVEERERETEAQSQYSMKLRRPQVS